MSVHNSFEREMEILDRELQEGSITEKEHSEQVRGIEKDYSDFLQNHSDYPEHN